MTDVQTTDYLAKIIKDSEGNYHVIDQDGTEGPICKLVDADDKTIALTKNASNRQWFNRKKADEIIATDGFVPLQYKASIKLGERSTTTVPNSKLIAYLTEELQAEYKAIIDRAIAARDADKTQPLTEAEKLQAKIAKLEASLAKLTNTEEDTNNG